MDSLAAQLHTSSFYLDGLFRGKLPVLEVAARGSGVTEAVEYYEELNCLKNSDKWNDLQKSNRRVHYGANGSKHIGKSRIQLAKILSEVTGLNIEGANIKPAKGRWRTDRRLDCHRWEVVLSNPSLMWGCFDTIGWFLKKYKEYGFYIEDGEISLGVPTLDFQAEYIYKPMQQAVQS